MVHISREESAAINSLRFLCVLTVVMLHSALNSDMKAVMGADVSAALDEWHNLFCIVPALPILFLLSGYLFFRNIGDHFDWKRDYVAKLKGRLVSLYLFYIVCSLLALIFNVFVKNLPVPSFSSWLATLWPLDPMSHPSGMGMWFIRNLIIFSILSPLYYLAARLLKHLCLPLCLYIHVCGLPVDFAYFNAYLLLGTYMAYIGISLTQLSTYLNWRIALAAVVIIKVCSWTLNMPSSEFINVLLITSVMIGLCLRWSIPRVLAASSTFIYVFHFFLLGGLKQILFKVMPHEYAAYVAMMLLAWFLAIAVCVCAFLVIRRSKILCLLLTGGRG